MIALRHLLGKSGPSSCTYENKCCATENERLRDLVLDLEARLVAALAAPSQTEAKFQRALDENALQLMLIEQLQAQITSKQTFNFAVQPAEYTALQERVSHLEAKLADTKEKLAKSVEAHTKAKAHITALQHQREQLVLELEQVEDGFQAEVEKLSGDLRHWKQDFSIDCDTIREDDAHPLPSSPLSTDSNPQTPIQTRESRSASLTSTDSPHGVLFANSLERTKTATRIWALEDEVERVRNERDALRRRLGAGRASLIQLKQQACEVRLGGKSMINLGRGLKSETQLGLGWGAATLGRKTGREGRKISAKASNIQLNTFVLPPMRGEPLTPDTSDDSASLEMKM